MDKNWTVGSVNGQETGQEGEWTNLDQIQGMQTLLTNNLFGISFRIIPRGLKKFSDVFIPEDTLTIAARDAASKKTTQ